jgi:hypothetical protein
MAGKKARAKELIEGRPSAFLRVANGDAIPRFAQLDRGNTP